MLKIVPCLLCAVIVGWASVGQAQPLSIIDKPIVFNEERMSLSLAYMKDRYGMTPSQPVIIPQMVVIHWTVYPTLEQSFQAFYPTRLPSSRAGIQHASSLNVSSHYLIDRDGTIYQLMPDTLMARHVIGLNYCAIGIENVGDGREYPLTEAQFKANVRLISELARKYPVEYLIGHHEYRKFIGHALWKEQDPTYLTDKDDPGDAFMTRLRNALSTFTFRDTPR